MMMMMMMMMIMSIFFMSHTDDDNDDDDEHLFMSHTYDCLFVLLLYIPSQQLWSLQEGLFS